MFANRTRHARIRAVDGVVTIKAMLTALLHLLALSLSIVTRVPKARQNKKAKSKKKRSSCWLVVCARKIAKIEPTMRIMAPAGCIFAPIQRASAHSTALLKIAFAPGPPLRCQSASFLRELRLFTRSRVALHCARHSTATAVPIERERGATLP